MIDIEYSIRPLITKMTRKLASIDDLTSVPELKLKTWDNRDISLDFDDYFNILRDIFNAYYERGQRYVQFETAGQLLEIKYIDGDNTQWRLALKQNT